MAVRLPRSRLLQRSTRDLADYTTDLDNDGTAELEAFNTDPYLALMTMLNLRFGTDIPIGRALLSDPDLAAFWEAFMEGLFSPSTIVAPGFASIAGGGAPPWEDYWISIDDYVVDTGSLIGDPFRPGVGPWSGISGPINLGLDATINGSWGDDVPDNPPDSIDSRGSSYLVADISPSDPVILYWPEGDITIEQGIIHYLIQVDAQMRMDYDGSVFAGFVDFEEDVPSWMALGVDFYIGFSVSADTEDVLGAEWMLPGKYIFRYELYTAFPDISEYEAWATMEEPFDFPMSLWPEFADATLSLMVYNNDDTEIVNLSFDGIEAIMGAFPGPR